MQIIDLKKDKLQARRKKAKIIISIIVLALILLLPFGKISAMSSFIL